MADPGESILGQWRAIVVCLIAALGAFQFGYDTSYFSGILVMDAFADHYGTFDAATGAKIVTSSRQSLVTSIINVGEFVGAVSAFWIGQKIGLRGGLLLACIIVVIGTTLQVADTALGLLIAGRLVLGYAVGLISNFVPLYLADCAPARVRGAIVFMYQFNIGIGLILGVCVDYATKERTDTGAFRIPMAVQYIFPIILSSGLLLFCPESPRWLAANNRIDDCEKSLQRLKGPDVDVHTDTELIVHQLHRESLAGEGSSWIGILRSSVELRKAYLGCALQALQQGTGINFITGYGPYFFTVIGIENPFIIQVTLYVVGIPVMWISQYGIEKLGRRISLIISGLPMAAALMIMAGVGLNLQEADPSLAASRTVVAMVFIYMIFFSVGWGPTVWVVCSEIATGRNRNKLMTLSTSVNWFFTWLVSFVFPYLFNADAANLQTKVGFIYGSITVVAVAWVFFLLPEPAGRSLEEIDYLFESRISARKFATTKVDLTNADDNQLPKSTVLADFEHKN
ncbi:hypothetical protein SCUCBS95973_003032 [Sporothrix curviconia]|uniref:Major facilitator superfamily (MFS) profile domain-containing protein n=1 Tax=Sporothrix curviconia TaxID=1260050 RepID=A0ABP0BBW1_9PEZI